MSKPEFIMVVLLLGVVITGVVYKEFMPSWPRGGGSVTDVTPDELAAVDDPLAAAAAEIRLLDATQEIDPLTGSLPGGTKDASEGLATDHQEDDGGFGMPSGVYDTDPYGAAYGRFLPPAPQDRLDINTASADELMRVPGVGSVLADRIVQHRTMIGSFRRMDDLMRIDGVGSMRMTDLDTFFTVGSPGTAMGGSAPSNPTRDVAPSLPRAANPWSMPETSRDGDSSFPSRDLSAPFGSADAPTGPSAGRVERPAQPTSPRVESYQARPMFSQPTPTRVWDR